jgi:hypothetical protein
VEASTDDRLRLMRQELTELASQQTATVEILNAISQSAFDLAAVFATPRSSTASTEMLTASSPTSVGRRRTSSSCRGW